MTLSYRDISKHGPSGQSRNDIIGPLQKAELAQIVTNNLHHHTQAFHYELKIKMGKPQGKH